MTSPELNYVENDLKDKLISAGWKFWWDNLNLKDKIFLDDIFLSSISKINNISIDEAKIILGLVNSLPQNQNGNKSFRDWIIGKNSYEFDKKDKSKTIYLIDENNLENNDFTFYRQVNQIWVKQNRFDMVLFINGIPVVLIENKFKDYIDWYDQLKRYERQNPNFLTYNSIEAITTIDGIKYSSTYAKLEYFFDWNLENFFFDKETIIDYIFNFIVYEKISSENFAKKISRPHQLRSVNKILERVEDWNKKSGLIWHTQWSGKSLTMILWSQKLIKSPKLKNPTIVIVVDRIDLQEQMNQNYLNHLFNDVWMIDNINELKSFLQSDTRWVVIFTIQKCREEFLEWSFSVTRDNIILFTDESHRTQEWTLWAVLKQIFPNAFRFGFTWTPIDKTDKNTFSNFSPDKQEKYLDKYSFLDALKDGTVLPVFYDLRLPKFRLKWQSYQEALEKMWIEDEKAIKKWVQTSEFIHNEDRVANIVKDISNHYKNTILPENFKAMIVCYDRKSCVLFKNELDKHFDSSASEVIFTVNQNDDENYHKYDYDKKEEKEIKDKYKKRDSELKFLIVTDKLLTWFDAPVAKVMYLDKPLKDHTLLQAIARVNRVYPNKYNWLIVDYFGVFENMADAISKFEQEEINGAFFNIEELKNKFKSTFSEIKEYLQIEILDLNDLKVFSQTKEKIEKDESKKNILKKLSDIFKIAQTILPDVMILEYSKELKLLKYLYTALKPEQVKPSEDELNKVSKLINESIEFWKIEEIVKIDSIESFTKFIEASTQIYDESVLIPIVKLSTEKLLQKAKIDWEHDILWQVFYEKLLKVYENLNTWKAKVKEFIEQFEQAKLEVEYLKKKKKWFVNETAMKMYLELKVNTDSKDKKDDKKFNLTWNIEEDVSTETDSKEDNWIISKINDFAKELEKDLYEWWKENDSYKIEIKRKILFFLKDNNIKDMPTIANQIIDKL